MLYQWVVVVVDEIDGKKKGRHRTLPVNAVTSAPGSGRL